MDEPRGGRRIAQAARVCLIVVLSLSTAAATATLTGWLVWKVSAEQPSESDARAMVEPLLPAGARITRVAADQPGTSGGGLPTWMWFDQPTNGGYTYVQVRAPGGDWSGGLASSLVDAMRADGWRAGQPAAELTAEVEGIRDGVYLSSDWSGEDARSIVLVRDSSPLLRWSVTAAWAAGLVIGAVASVVAIRRTVRRQGGGRRGPEVRDLVVALAVLGPATSFATFSLGLFLDPTRHQFALAFWGAYTLTVPWTPLLLLVVLALGGVATGARRLHDVSRRFTG